MTGIVHKRWTSVLILQLNNYSSRTARQSLIHVLIVLMIPPASDSHANSSRAIWPFNNPSLLFLEDKGL
jgi:hypothetical protein